VQVADRYADAMYASSQSPIYTRVMAQLRCSHFRRHEDLIVTARGPYTAHGRSVPTTGGWDVTVTVTFPQGDSSSTTKYFVVRDHGRYYVCG
jgi:hypothetical protein